MSRFNTQQRLSQGPRDFQTSDRLIPSPQSIAPARANDIGALLSGAVQVTGQVLAANNAAQKQQDAEDFQTTLNELAIKKEAYERDEIPASELLQDYDAARERFENPQHQAQLIQFGEPFKTRLDTEAEKRAVAATAGFFDTKFKELSVSLTQDQEFVGDIAQLSFPDQLEAIRGELLASIPPEMLETVRENPEFESAITDYVLNIARTTASVRTEQIQRQEAKVRQYAVDHAITGIMNGADPEQTFTTLVTEQGIPAEEVVSQTSDAIVGNVKAAEAVGSLGDLAVLTYRSEDILNAVPQRFGKERAEIASAISQAKQSIGVIVGDSLVNRASAAKIAGATPEEVQGAMVDRLLVEAETVFGTDFETYSDLLTFVPQNDTERALHKGMLDVYNAVRVQEEEATKAVRNAVAATQNPDNSPPADASAPLDMGRDDLAQYLDGIQATESDPNILRLVDAARTDRSALVHLLTSVYNDSTRAGVVASKVGEEHLSTDTITTPGLQQVFAAVDGLGSPDDIPLITGRDDWAKQYALQKAYAAFSESGEILPEVYNTALQQYEQAQFETSSGERQDLVSALNDQKVFKKITGKAEGQFTPRQMSVLLQTINIGNLKETGSGFDTNMLVYKAKQALGTIGIYPVSDAVLGEGRVFVGMTNSKAVPEAIGVDTADVEEGLNNRNSRLDRFLATQMTSGEHNSMWTYAHQRITSALPEGDPRREILTLNELTAKARRGEAAIRLNTAQAGDTVPVVLVLSGEGQQNRTMVLGYLNFSDATISSVVSQIGKRGLKAPSKTSTPLFPSHVDTGGPNVGLSGT